MSLLFPELVGKCLEHLKQVVPRVGRIALLWQPGAVPERAAQDNLREADAAARALAVQLQVVAARGPADIDRAFSDMTRERAGALTVLSTPMLASQRWRLVDLAAKHRLPTVFSFREYVDQGRQARRSSGPATD